MRSGLLRFVYWLRTSDRPLWWAYTLAAVGITIQRLALTARHRDGYTAYENYVIFRNSFGHLVAGLNPYAAYPAEQWDLFKYSPAFAVAMAPWSVLPDGLGLLLWNLLNALVLLAAVVRLPVLAPGQRRFVGWFIFLEMITSLQNSQCNALVAALILWTWIALERDRPGPAAMWTAVGAFVKIFGIFAALPAMLYPRRAAFAGWLLTASLALAAVPLVVVSPERLAGVYGEWAVLLGADHSASVGLSVLGWLQSWFGWAAPKAGVTAFGLLALAAGVLGAAAYPSPHVRVRTWAALLLWVVVFNHKAESPTFVIALTGVALWYVVSARTTGHRVLLWTVFALASLSTTDLFPAPVRQHLVQPYVLKAVPCIVVWAAVIWELVTRSWRGRQPIDQYSNHQFRGHDRLA